MALNKCEYCDGETVIKAENLNAIQDAICDLEQAVGEGSISPTATVEQTDTGATITITDKDGTTTATITNGKSAYAYAQDGGYAGTEEEFATDLARVVTLTAAEEASV